MQSIYPLLCVYSYFANLKRTAFVPCMGSSMFVIHNNIYYHLIHFDFLLTHFESDLLQVFVVVSALS